MPKLFSKDDQIKVQLNAEHYRNAEVLSLEAITDYLGKTKDFFHSFQTTIFDFNSDQALHDAISTRHETLAVIKRLQFVDIADEVVTKPEKFQGKYHPYLKDLIDVCKVSAPDTLQLLNTVKLGLASFINEYTEDGVLSVYGTEYAKDSAKKIQNGQKVISSYFPESKSTFKTRVKDVLRNLGEVEGLYNGAVELESHISHDKVKQISKLADEISDMVDVLIEQNNKSGILLRNTEAKKDLTDMIHTAAESVRFTSYLYANTLYFYKALQSLSETLLMVGKR